MINLINSCVACPILFYPSPVFNFFQICLSSCDFMRNPKVHVLMVCTSTCRQPVRPFCAFWHGGGGAATLTRHKHHTHLHVAFPEGGAGSCCRGVDGELRLPPSTSAVHQGHSPPARSNVHARRTANTKGAFIDCYRE